MARSSGCREMLSGAGKNRGAHRTPFQPARSRVRGGPFAPRCSFCDEREETIDALAFTIYGLLVACLGLVIALVAVAC